MQEQRTGQGEGSAKASLGGERDGFFAVEKDIAQYQVCGQYTFDNWAVWGDINMCELRSKIKSTTKQ